MLVFRRLKLWSAVGWRNFIAYYSGMLRPNVAAGAKPQSLAAIFASCDACCCGSRAGVQRGGMLPNVRLMIAAMLASMAVLICGFGMFAAFQVSHEPLVRLPSASAPQQRSADSLAAPMAYAAPEPFARRFQIGEASNAVEAVEALARKIDHRASIQSASPPAEPTAAEVNTTTAAVEAPRDATRPPVPQSSGKDREEVAAPAADDHAAAAAAPDAAATASTAAPAPTVAMIEPSAEQPSRPEQPKSETEAAPANVTKSPTEAKKIDTPAVKEPRRAAKTHRRHRVPAALAESQTFSDPTFQQAQTQARRTRVRHAKNAVPKPPEPGSAIGGPLVSPAGR